MFDINPNISDIIEDITTIDLPLTETPVFDPAPLDALGPFTIGDPTIIDCELQIMPDNCAVEAERSIINLFVNPPLSQQDAMYVSATNGWYQPGAGTSMTDIGQMMDTYGIPNHTVVDASVADLARELAMGHGVIVGVDSEELWDNGPLAELKQWLSETFGIDFGDIGANHAVVVTGIDVTDPANPMVIINDSGVPGGEGQPYPMDKFLQSWEDSNCYYTATDVPLPSENLHGSAENMNTALGDILGDLTGAFIAGFTGAAAFSLTGDPITAVAVGADAGMFTNDLVESFFSDDSTIAAL